MTTKNAILLIIKQNNGIDYNTLLNKISPSYGSVNSARAALSRAVKDLNALTMVQRQGNKLFITDKGNASINIEMKTKLLIRLNELIKSKDNVAEIDSIVQFLQTLIERGKADADLLKAARGFSDFYISDLAQIKGQVDKRMAHLDYLGKILSEQINSLQQLNFNDSKRLEWNEKTVALLQQLPEKTGAADFTATASSEQFLQLAAEKLQAKLQDRTISLNQAQFPAFLELVSQQKPMERNMINIFLPSITLRIIYPEVFLSGPFEKIRELAPDA